MSLCRYIDKTLTEKMLSTEYHANGFVVHSSKDAAAALKKLGFNLMRGEWRGKRGKVARIYELRNSILSSTYPFKPVSYTPAGWLVSFGGEPKSCYELEFSKITNPAL